MLNEIENKIFSFEFQCVRCGNCCTQLPKGIPLFYKDIRGISPFINLDVNDFVLQHCKLEWHEVFANNQRVNIPVLYLETFDKCCVFYKDNRCSIHKVKPYYCKAAPFISLLFQDENCIKFYKENCKGFGQGTYYSKKKIKQILMQEIKLEGKEWQAFHNGSYDDFFSSPNCKEAKK